MGTIEKKALRTEVQKSRLQRLLGAAALSASVLMLSNAAEAKQVTVEATGKIIFVNEFLGSSFTMGDTGSMTLVYDLETKDSDESPTVGKYGDDALRLFQIRDSIGAPFFNYNKSPAGALTVTDRGASNDSFTIESFTGVRTKQDPNNGMGGGERNKLPLLGAYFSFRGSKADVFKNDSLPTAFGKLDSDWPSPPPTFAMQYCSSCGTGGGFGRGVTFEITKMKVTVTDSDPIPEKADDEVTVNFISGDELDQGQMTIAAVAMVHPGLGIVRRSAVASDALRCDGLYQMAPVDSFSSVMGSCIEDAFAIWLPKWKGEGPYVEGVPSVEPRGGYDGVSDVFKKGKPEFQMKVSGAAVSMVYPELAGAERQELSFKVSICAAKKISKNLNFTKVMQDCVKSSAEE